MASPSRSSGDEDLDVALKWPDDPLQSPTPNLPGSRARAKPGRRRAISAGGRGQARAALPAVRKPPAQEAGPTDAVDALSKRIDALSEHVTALTEALEGDSKHQLAAIGDLRGRLRGELKSLDEAVDVVRELREAVTAGLADRDERRAELGSVMADLAEEVRSLRRKMAVPSKAQAAKRDREQAKAIADAVVAALGGAAGNGPAARTPRRRG